MKTMWKAALALLLLAPAARARDLEIYFIDVMGGASTLVVTPERESILIDTGWPGQDDRDPKRIAHVLKDVAGLDHLDHLVITHWHMDHYGGVAGLAKLVRIDHVWDRGLPSDQIDGLDFPEGPKQDDPLMVAYLEATKDKRRALKAGDRLPITGVEALVLASGGKVIDAPADASANPLCEDAPEDRPADNSDNARSLAIRFRLGKFDFLDCGDLTWNVEKKLVCPANLVGQIDVYQVTHHGLDISNHPTLLKTIQPTITVMNNGPRKGGSAAVVKLLQSVPSIEAAYQLHKNAATGDDENTDPKLIANGDAEGGKFIEVRVEPDGAAYTVRINAEGKARSIQSK
jgi:beta-lactamase superfamily II metal-dependent hydrolase